MGAGAMDTSEFDYVWTTHKDDFALVRGERGYAIVNKRWRRMINGVSLCSFLGAGRLAIVGMVGVELTARHGLLCYDVHGKTTDVRTTYGTRDEAGACKSLPDVAKDSQPFVAGGSARVR